MDGRNGREHPRTGRGAVLNYRAPFQDGLLPPRVELDYWALTGWMTLGALTLLIVLVSIGAAFPHLPLR